MACLIPIEYTLYELFYMPIPPYCEFQVYIVDALPILPILAPLHHTDKSLNGIVLSSLSYPTKTWELFRSQNCPGSVNRCSGWEDICSTKSRWRDKSIGRMNRCWLFYSPIPVLLPNGRQQLKRSIAVHKIILNDHLWFRMLMHSSHVIFSFSPYGCSAKYNIHSELGSSSVDSVFSVSPTTNFWNYTLQTADLWILFSRNSHSWMRRSSSQITNILCTVLTSWILVWIRRVLIGWGGCSFTRHNLINLIVTRTFHTKATCSWHRNHTCNTQGRNQSNVVMPISLRWTTGGEIYHYFNKQLRGIAANIQHRSHSIF